jgi:MFS family permease
MMGLAIGISSTVAPIYIAECAVTSRRGALATIPQLCVSSGIMLALMMSFLVTLMEKSSWRLM